jgi:SAM-dependent methyltransferase
MVDWGKGYITDIEYTEHFYLAQAPQILALTAVFNGIEPPNLDGRFAYCELGCGRGVTSLILAAVNPQAVFHAVDFNPASIARAQARARSAGLDNITFHERSFEELTEPSAGLPMFDIITMHGVWSWVAPDQQQAILAFLKSHLKPGGLVYISYNALPAWNGMMPLQRLLRELAAAQPNSSDQAIGNAIAMINRLAEKKIIPPRFQDEINRLNARHDPMYLAHEYLHTGWAPYYFADVARALGDAKLSYVGSTRLLTNFWNLDLNEEQRTFLFDIAAPELRETLKDFCTNNWFRQDVYVRGARSMTDARRQSLMNGLTLALVCPAPRGAEVVTPDGAVFRPDPATFGRFFEALERRPHSVAELLSLPGLPLNHMVGAHELVGPLFNFGLAGIWREPSRDAEDSAARLNKLTEALGEIPMSQTATIAVPTLGLGLEFASDKFALYTTLRRGETPDASALAARFVSHCHEVGQVPIVGGKPITDATEAFAALTKQYATLIEQCVPIWRMLGMVS